MIDKNMEAQPEEPGDTEEQFFERLREDTCSEDDEGVPFYDASLADNIIREYLRSLAARPAEDGLREALEKIAHLTLSMPPAYGNPEEWFYSVAREAIGIAVNAVIPLPPAIDASLRGKPDRVQVYADGILISDAPATKPGGVGEWSGENSPT